LIEVYGRLATDCGYLPSAIDAMTLDDVEEIFEFWKKHPPMRVLAEAYLGYKPAEEAPKPAYMTADDMRRMMKMTRGRIPGVGYAP
jgi:hypothetical protein